MDLEPSIRQFNVGTFGTDTTVWPNHISSPEAKPAEFLGVREGEYVLAKTHHDAFVSSNLGYVLENLGVKHIVFIGGHTDACLGKTSIAAKERGYRTLCVEDATFSGLRSLWRSGLLNSRYDYIVTTEEFCRLVESARGQ
jgi:nicotinamidase-related amidase